MILSSSFGASDRFPALTLHYPPKVVLFCHYVFSVFPNEGGGQKVAKDAVLQVRLDPELKQEAEKLYSAMGISLSEAIRMFLAKSVNDQRLPFNPSSERARSNLEAYGILNIFASPTKREQERDAWISSLDQFGDSNKLL